jgi:hypothetical protein
MLNWGVKKVNSPSETEGEFLGSPHNYADNNNDASFGAYVGLIRLCPSGTSFKPLITIH